MKKKSQESYKKQISMKSIVEQTRELPPGVLGNVLTFIPRNETAQLMLDAYEEDKLVLTHLPEYRVKDGLYKDELFATLSPLVTGKSMYGDEDSRMKILRNKNDVRRNAAWRSRLRAKVLLRTSVYGSSRFLR